MCDDPDLHRICYLTADAYRERLKRARREYLAQIDADQWIGLRIRQLCLPGRTRKTIRVDELRSIVTEADAERRGGDHDAL